MSISTGATREQLLATNEEFRRLKEDHSRYEEQIGRLTAKHYQTEEEKVEEKRLKKLKRPKRLVYMGSNHWCSCI